MLFLFLSSQLELSLKRKDLFLSFNIRTLFYEVSSSMETKRKSQMFPSIRTVENKTCHMDRIAHLFFF